jgi:exonuclease III
MLNSNFGNREWDCSNNTRSLNSNNSTPLLLYHQNIRGLQNKIDELSKLWSTNFPHVLCFTEHHLRNDETLPFTAIELSEFCNDQDIEICAVKSHFSSSNFCVLSVYRPPCGKFIHFLNSLDTILNQLHNNSLNIIICGD